MRRSLAALLAALTVLLSGCWDMTEIEDTVYVASIGVDPADGEYMWSFRIVEPEKLVLGMLSTVPGEPGRLASGTIVVRAQSLEQAVQLIQPSLARVVSLQHVRWIGIGDELARRGIAPVLSQLLRHNELRRGVGLYVMVGQSLSGFLNNRPVADVNAIKFFEGVRIVQKRVHLSPPLQLQHFYSRLMSPGLDPTLALVGVNKAATKPPGGELPPASETYIAGQIPRLGGNPVEFVGTAVFRGDRLVGMLTVNETEAFLALRGEMGKVYASVPDPKEEGRQITFRIHQENKPQFRAAFAGNRPIVHVKLQVECEVLAIQGRTDYSVPQNRRILEQHVARFLKEGTLKPLLKRMHGEWGADPVGFGQLFRTRFPTLDAWLAYRWPDHVKDLAVTVDVEVFIRRFGMMFGNPLFIEPEGK